MLKNIGPDGRRQMLNRRVGHPGVAREAFAQVRADVGRGDVERERRVDQHMAGRRGLEYGGAGLPRGDFLRDGLLRRAESEAGTGRHADVRVGE